MRPSTWISRRITHVLVRVGVFFFCFFFFFLQPNCVVAFPLPFFFFFSFFSIFSFFFFYNQTASWRSHCLYFFSFIFFYFVSFLQSSNCLAAWPLSSSWKSAANILKLRKRRPQVWTVRSLGFLDWSLFFVATMVAMALQPWSHATCEVKGLDIHCGLCPILPSPHRYKVDR